jgi:hypothetical protein
MHKTTEDPNMPKDVVANTKRLNAVVLIIGLARTIIIDHDVSNIQLFIVNVRMYPLGLVKQVIKT